MQLQSRHCGARAVVLLSGLALVLGTSASSWAESPKKRLEKGPCGETVPRYTIPKSWTPMGVLGTETKTFTKEGRVCKWKVDKVEYQETLKNGSISVQTLYEYQMISSKEDMTDVYSSGQNAPPFKLGAEEKGRLDPSQPYYKEETPSKPTVQPRKRTQLSANAQQNRQNNVPKKPQQPVYQNKLYGEGGIPWPETGESLGYKVTLNVDSRFGEQAVTNAKLEGKDKDRYEQGKAVIVGFKGKRISDYQFSTTGVWVKPKGKDSLKGQYVNVINEIVTLRMIKVRVP